MYTHLVILKPERMGAFNINRVPAADQNSDRQIAYAEDELPARSYEVSNFQNWGNVKQVFCESEASAIAAAKIMAYFHPGKEVYLASLTGLYTAKPNAPVAVAVSEKGMVPK
jgi:hypothetical protein